MILWRATVSVLCCCGMLTGTRGTLAALRAQASQERVVIPSRGWELVGDLTRPASGARSPAVLLLNEAAGDRKVYRELAAQLALRGVASLRLDLPGHGESINRGRFVPGEVPRDPMIWDAETAVADAHAWLRGHRAVRADRVAIVGASYSGEEMAEAGRTGEKAAAYVALSPGSFSDASIDWIDASGIPWLFVVSRNDPFLREITIAVRERSRLVELLVLPGDEHATRLLDAHPSLAERLAAWLAEVLTRRP